MSWRYLRFLLASACVVCPAPVQALDLSGGVSVGGILIGSTPQLAITPNARGSYRFENGFSLSAHELLSLLPAVNSLGIGVYNQTSATLGYQSEQFIVSIGPSLAIYSTPVCVTRGRTLCGRMVGIGPGVHADADWYIAGPFGVSVSASVDWLGGQSLLIPSGVSAMITIGPVLRWKSW